MSSLKNLVLAELTRASTTVSSRKQTSRRPGSKGKNKKVKPQSSLPSSSTSTYSTFAQNLSTNLPPTTVTKPRMPNKRARKKLLALNGSSSRSETTGQFATAPPSRFELHTPSNNENYYYTTRSDQIAGADEQHVPIIKSKSAYASALVFFTTTSVYTSKFGLPGYFPSKSVNRLVAEGGPHTEFTNGRDINVNIIIFS
jgi:hypothetical protein